MRQKAVLSVTVEKDILKAAKILAEAENRTLSNYIETVLKDMAIRKGVIKPKKQKK